MITNDFLAWNKNLEKSGIQKALETLSSSDSISFALGKPDNELLVFSEIKNLYENLFSPRCLQYSPPPLELKTHIAELMKKRGVFCEPEEVFLTTGSQQAMILLITLLVRKNTSILVDQLTYPGFIQAAQSMGSNLRQIPVCFKTGLKTEEINRVLSKGPKPSLIYTIPEGHNPLGVSLSQEKREELIRLAKQYQIPIIEDDAYGFLNYGPAAPSLKSHWNEGVLYIGSFSKLIAPSVRVGWIVTSKEIIEKLEILKESFDVNTSTVGQHFINSFFTKNFLENHILNLKKQYKIKRDIMVKSLKTHIPEMEFSIPNSGFFIWGKLPSSINTDELFKLALEKEKVSFIPGRAFLIGKRTNILNCLRLNFTFCPIELIDIGVERLARAIHSYKEIKKTNNLCAA